MNFFLKETKSRGQNWICGNGKVEKFKNVLVECGNAEKLTGQAK